MSFSAQKINRMYAGSHTMYALQFFAAELPDADVWCPTDDPDMLYIEFRKFNIVKTVDLRQSTDGVMNDLREISATIELEAKHLMKVSRTAIGPRFTWRGGL